ncbi:MAG: efflux RND transporter periplasmic adaptor subunit [Planctomycetaceae bacterium]|nr:efflux RND transporter periplasmic adaptor subunit [Planctomycetaceae bacterium]
MSTERVVDAWEKSQPVPDRLWNHLTQLRGLLTQNLPAHAFFELLLSKCCELDDVSAGGVWMAGESRKLALYLGQNFESENANFDSTQNQRNQDSLVLGWQAEKPILAESPFPGDPDGKSVLLIPLRNRRHKVGVIQFFLKEAPDRYFGHGWQAAFQELKDVGDRFLQRSEESARAADPVESLAVLRTMTERIHRSLSLQETANAAVNEMRGAFQCDRVSLFLGSPGKPRLVAVSGVENWHPRSRQVGLLTTFLRRVTPSGQRFLFLPGESQDLEFATELADYLVTSGTSVVLIEPVFPPPNDSAPFRNRRRPSVPLGWIVCEHFQDDLPSCALLQRIEFAATQAGMAIAKAQQYHRLEMIPGLRMLGAICSSVRSSWSLTAIFLILMSAVLISGMVAIPVEFAVNCQGHLVPTLQRPIYAPQDGEVAEIYVDESEVVTQGQKLLRLHSPELDAEILSLRSQLSERAKSRESVRADLHRAVSSKHREDSTRLQAQVEVLNIEIDSLARQLALLENQQQRLVIHSPIRGTVTTQQARQHLASRPVQRGESLLEVIDTEGSWHLEIEIPERKIGHVKQAFDTSAGMPISFRAAPFPELVCPGTLLEIATRADPNPVHGSTVGATAWVSREDIPVQRIGTEANVRIPCGQRSLLYVWFGEFYEFLQRTWWL